MPSLFSHHGTSQEKMEKEQLSYLQRNVILYRECFSNVPKPKGNAKLSDFIVPDSISFHMLNIKTDDLLKLVKDWIENPNFNHGKNVVNILYVNYNNDAEREVKLYTDALNVAKSEDRLENNLQVVENARGWIINERKI